MLFGIRWGSLRAKILAWAFVPAAIILTAVAVVTFVTYQQVTADLVIERNRDLIRLSASQLRSELTEHAQQLQAEARLPVMYGGDLEDQGSALKAAGSRLAVFDGGILLLDSYGMVLASEPARPEILGKDWADRSYYRGVLQAEVHGSLSPACSDIVGDGPDGMDVIALAVPVKGPRGEFAGVLVGMFQIGDAAATALYGDIAKLRIGDRDIVYLVDGSGRLIYHSDTSRIGDDVSGLPAVQQVLEGQTAAIRTHSLEEQEIVASFAPVSGTSWGLITEENWRALLSASQPYRQSLLVLLALGVLVPALVVWVGVRRLTRPITDLIQGARQVASGNFGQTVSASTGDEIEELAVQFNRMSAQLQASYAKLEHRVASRTNELAALNAIASVVSQSLDLQEILNGALDTTLAVMGIEAGGIYLLDRFEGLLTIAAQRGLSDELASGIDRLKIGEGFSGRVVESGEPLVIRDISDDSRLSRMMVQDAGFHSVAIVPLSCKQKILGTLFTICSDVREFSPQEIQVLTSIGHQIGIAIDSASLFLAEHRRADQFRVITEVGHRITSILDIDQVLVQLVRLVQQAFEYDHVGIALVEEDKVAFKVGAGTLWDDPDFEFRPKQLTVGTDGVTGWVAASGEPLLVPDVSKEPRFVRAQGSATQSELALPIKFKGQVLGVLDVQSDELNAFDASDLTVMQTLATQAATAIENARLFHAAQRRAEQFRVISEVGQHMTSILDIEELLDEIVHLIRKTFGYYLVDVALIEDNCLNVKAGAGDLFGDPAFRPASLDINGKGIMPWVARTGKAVIVPDVSREPRYLSLPDGLQTRSELAVPLRTKAAIIGVLDVQSDRLDDFDDSDLAVVQSLANQAATAIENAWLFKAEQRRADQFRVISEVGRQITAILTEDELLVQMARSIQQAFGYYHVGVGLVDGDHVISRAEVGGSAEACRDVRLKVGEEGVWGWVADTGQPRLSSDVSQDPFWAETPGAPEIRSQVCVPLQTKEAVIGVLSAESDRPNTFDGSDLVVLQALAHQAAFAIENARFFRDTTRQVRDLRALADASRIITSVLDQDELLLALYRQIRRIAPTDYYLIALYDESTNLLRIEVNVDDGVHLPKEKHILAEGLLAEIILERTPLRLPSLLEEPGGHRLSDIPRQSDQALHGWLGVPMLYGDKVVGAIAVASFMRETFDEWHEQALSSIANQGAVAVENAKLYGQAQQLAVMEERQRLARELHDAVTQTLFSASLISEALPEIWESDPDEGRLLLADLQQLSRGALAEMRTLLLELRPTALIDASLEDLLRQLGEAVAGRTGASVELSLEGRFALPLDVHVALYRIAQEALNNVTKHSIAGNVHVHLKRKRADRAVDAGKRMRVELRVTDDGQGFSLDNVPPDRFGLGIIHERAEAIGASLSIVTSPGNGTEIAVQWEEPQGPNAAGR